MIDRCRPQGPYGKLGITVCARWWAFSDFLADMGERPEGRVLDRRDPRGNYEPGNCRWSLQRSNCQYRRTTKLTPARRHRARKLRAAGLSHRAIAEALGVAKSTVSALFSGAAWGRYPLV